MRTDSTPTGKFDEQFNALFFTSSPYSWPVLGWPSDLDAITRVSCRLRLMVFGQQVDGPVWSVQGGVANLSPHWKVSGADAKYDARGALLGSAFTDVRMASPGEAL